VLLVYTPMSTPIAKPEPSYYPALAVFDIKVDRKSKFPVLLLAMATVYRTIANARLRSELTKGVYIFVTTHAVKAHYVHEALG
jgi:hypothetical protein